jgi:Fe-S cluster assembly protein SufD
MNAVTSLTPAEESLGVALPSRRLEEWKWTDLKRIIQVPYKAAASADTKTVDRLVAASPFASLKLHRLVLINGKLDRKHSHLTGLKLSETAPVVTLDDPLISLNGKLGTSDVSLTFEGTADKPVEVLFITTGKDNAVATRLHIEVEAGASATIVETHIGEGSYLHAPLVTMKIDKGARLDRVKLEHEAATAQHLSQVIVDLEQTAIFNDFTFTSGAQLSRQNANVNFNGQNAQARVNGSYLLKNSQHADTRLVVDHRVPHCESRELFKCVMQDKARGIFQGKVIVRKDAQKTDGKQSSHALLLSETAEFDAKPELEIYADDVVCGHGTTCGDLNHDHLFYLKSRGIPEATARAMLVEAFVSEAFEAVENEQVREVLGSLLHEPASR